MEKDIKQVLISKEEIQKTVNKLAFQIDEDYKNQNFIMVGLLKGSIIFMADLMRAVKSHCTIDFIVASSYGSKTKTSGRLNIVKDISQSITGCNVLVVEDIIDSGVTLGFIVEHLKSKKAKSVRICTLLDKPERRQSKIKVNYVGHTIPNEFVVGYGMDYNEQYRGLPYIGVLKQEIYS